MFELYTINFSLWLLYENFAKNKIFLWNSFRFWFKFKITGIIFNMFLIDFVIMNVFRKYLRILLLNQSIFVLFYVNYSIENYVALHDIPAVD